MAWVQRADLTGPPGADGADGSDADVTAHEAAGDPHPQYMTSAETAAAFQPLDADLSTIAGLTATTDRILQSKAGAWTTRTPVQVKADMALAKADVGLGSVDNTADTAKPVSSAQQSALDLKANLSDTRLTVKPFPPVTLTDATTIAIDASLGTHFRVSTASARTLGNPTNPTDGQVIVVEHAVTGGTARLLSLGTSYAYGTDITALSTTTSGTTDLLQFVYKSSSSKWWLIAYVKGFPT